MIPVTKKVPLLDLHALHQPLREEILAAITSVVDGEKFIMGDEVKQLEREIASYTGVPYAVGCASGSDALYIALMALDLGPGDEVLTTPFSFFATAGSISRTGATPVFVDIDPLTYNLDPMHLAETLKKHPKAKAIIPVHLFGACADMDPILELAREHRCAVVEDGAQSIGAEYKGRKAQSMGDIGCISFFPSKNLGGFGDGGMTTTNNEALAKKMASLRLHGTTKKYYHEWIGTNSRLDTIQAAVLRVKLRYLDSWTEGRQRNAAEYRRLLDGVSSITLPVEMPYQTRHVYNQFVIRCLKRDELQSHLGQNGAGTEIYYPLSLHLQKCYSPLGYREGDFPESERAQREVLAIPVHSALPLEDLKHVASLIREF